MLGASEGPEGASRASLLQGADRRWKKDAGAPTRMLRGRKGCVTRGGRFLQEGPVPCGEQPGRLPSVSSGSEGVLFFKYLKPRKDFG